MRKMMIFLASCAMLFAAQLQGQCPPRDTLRNRIIYLRDTLKSPLQEQLKELLGYAVKMSNCSYKNESTHVFLLGRIGDIYFKQADFLKAVEYRRKAIDIITANAGKPSVKLRTLPGRYYYLSVAYDSLNNFAEKMSALDSSSAIAMRLKYMDRASLMALYTRVEYYFDIGDYRRCIDYATKCEQLGQEFASIEPDVGAGYASSSLGWHVEALLKLKKFEPAENILANKIKEYKKVRLINYLGLVYAQMAQVQEQKGNFEKALVYFDQSLKYYLEDKDYFNCKQTLKDIGYKIYFKHLNDGDKALVYFKKALKYSNGDKFRKTADNFESLNTFSNIGSVYVQKGLYDSAFTYFQLAFDQVKPGGTEEDILRSTPQEMMQFKRNYYLTDLLINKGYAFRKQYGNNKQKSCIDKAINIYKVADQLLDRIKTEQTELESKLSWRSDSRRLYENAIEACYLQGNTSDAFYFFEKSRAVLLNDQLNENRFVAGKDIMRQTEIKKKINQLQNEFTRANKSSGRLSELQDEIFNYKRELDNVNQAIKSKNPLYYQSFLDSAFVTIEEFRAKSLNDHQALVEIFTGDSAVYVLLLTEQNTRLKRIDKANYDKLSRTFLGYISNFDLLNRDYEGFRTVAGDLYQLIFGGMLLPAGRLIISPDGQYFPFESLIINEPGQRTRWFLEDYAVSYTYSARFLMNDFKPTKNSGKNFLGIAPVNFPSSFSLAPLPGSDGSVKKIAANFRNGASWLDLEASRANFLAKFSQYKIVQLYTHASDSSANNEPVIYFSDSALYLSDLINEYVPVTELIVLSACETGQGKTYQGEGVFSFNRGFAALGIPSAITNLWSVDNESTYRLTELFYKWLAKGFPTDAALQKAKLEFLQTASKEKSLPCYWAGSILMGETDAIELGKPYNWAWITGIAGLGFLMISGIGKWLFSSKRTRTFLSKSPQEKHTKQVNTT